MREVYWDVRTHPKTTKRSVAQPILSYSSLAALVLIFSLPLAFLLQVNPNPTSK